MTQPAQAPLAPRVVVVLATVVYVAALIAIWGFTSLALDQDVVSDLDAGPLVGPAMAVAASLVLFLVLRSLHRRTSPVASVVAAIAGAYLAMLLVGAVGRTLSGPLASGALFAATYATSLFVILPAVAAGVTVVVVWALTRPRGSGDGRPSIRWRDAPDI